MLTRWTANSDRRPVDPPPVVELRVLDGVTVEEAKDITFDYNANFFLYASLEHARPLAHGRVQTPAASNPPILTGVPASGMAYLDRPTEAGYFIFPDLSVRHEGRYRLAFSLFETTKEERDFDRAPAGSELPPGVDWRMEIKTQPFSVYSAKKFPGLMESTQLSKTVADQGCRVRIRRDVRMRKRDSGAKSGNGYDRREEEYARRRTATPAAEDPHSLRARSMSNSSEHRVPYVDSRRSSAVDGYAIPPPPPPPAYEPAQVGPRHLSFGGPSAPQYPAPRQYAPQSSISMPPVSPTGPYPSSSQSPYTKPETPAYVKPEMFPYPGPRNTSTCPSPASSLKHDPYDRRPSNSGYVPPSPSYSASDSHVRRDSHVSSYPATPVAAQPPRPTLAPLKIASLVSPLPPIVAQDEYSPAPPPVPTGGKRKLDSVFAESSRPLHNGERQSDPHHSGSRRGLSPEPDHGYYLRADGLMGIVTFNKYQS